MPYSLACGTARQVRPKGQGIARLVFVRVRSNFGPMAARAPRPKTKHFSSASLVEAWTPLLKLREPGFRWDGSSSEDQYEWSVPVAKVMLYRKPLEALVSLADTGFPAHGDLEKTLHLIQKSFPAAFNVEQLGNRVLSEIVVAWRSMCKTLYELKKSGCFPAEIQGLVDKIVLPIDPQVASRSSMFQQVASRSSMLPHVPASCPTFQQVASRSSESDSCLTVQHSKSDSCLTVQQVADMFEKADTDEDDSDVEVVAVRCGCEKCMAARGEGEKKDAPPIPKGEGEKKDAPPIPSAAKGGQRKETEASRRLRKKTTVAKAKTKAMKAMKTMKAMKATKKAKSTVVAPPCQIVKRIKDKAAYILAKDKVYVASASFSRSGPLYLKAIGRLAEEIDKGSIVDVGKAREWLEEFFKKNA